MSIGMSTPGEDSETIFSLVCIIDCDTSWVTTEGGMVKTHYRNDLDKRSKAAVDVNAITVWDKVSKL